MKNTIIITSIFDPTEAVRKFAALPEHQLIVVGDRKTPPGWQSPGVDFFSIDEQLNSNSQLAQLIPEGTYQRKNCGYLRAIQEGAEVIIDTDDDNIPYDDWAMPEYEGEFDYLADGLGMVNIYQLFTPQKIWPRGLELKLINTDFALAGKLSKRRAKVGVWQGLADKDPDVDAIYRLTSNQECTFNKRPPVVLGRNTLCPYNSQNTATVKQLFPLLYLPVTSSFRFTDILRGWVAQPIMWAHGYHLGFLQATVYQERNAHDFMEDFKSEIPMYTDQARAIELATELASAKQSVADNLLNIYTALVKEQILRDTEIPAVNAWLQELTK